jgi:hypothetical protein
VSRAAYATRDDSVEVVAVVGGAIERVNHA